MRDIIGTIIGIGEAAVTVVHHGLGTDQYDAVISVFVCDCNRKIIDKGCQVDLKDIVFAVIGTGTS